MRLKGLLLFALLLVSALQAKIAPNFRGELLSGGRITLKEVLNPARPLLLCFWASWCTPCLEELNKVKAGLKENPELLMDVVTVNVDTAETSSDVKSMIKLYQLPFKVIMDPEHKIFSKYHGEKSLPFSVLVEPSGNIIKTFSGYHEDMMAQIKVSVSTLLGRN